MILAYRPAEPGDRDVLVRLAGLASAAHDAFVFADADAATAFNESLVASEVGEFSARWSTLAVADGGRVIGHVALLSAAELRATRLKAAMWLARAQFAARQPDAARRLQLAAGTGVRPEPDDAYLSRIAVDPDAGIRGVGRALLDHTLSSVRARGERRLVLDVAADNVRARAFYEQAGFAEIGRARVVDDASRRSLEYIHLARRLTEPDT